MKLHRFARRLSPILTAYLLVVSLGLPLHKVYCACRGITDVSLFEQDHQCGHGEAVLANNSEEHATISEAKVARANCCSKAAQKSCDFKQVDKHDCGDEETILAKFTTDYLVSEKQQPADINSWVALLPEGPVFGPAYVLEVPKALPIRGPDPPPLPYGRNLLLRQQLFLC